MAPGNASLSALHTVAEDPVLRPSLLDERAPKGSNGCGSVVRSAPFGRIPSKSSDLDYWIVPSAMQVAGFTNAHPTVQITSAALAMMIY